ncbi:WbqC family protein [Polaribacter undariae]|uniref:WbqC family protein n=1 Tax=Polaribacter sejongensis TaxID=985043 RepID=A0AAJ1QWG1_9FLAO|nr:WbqC family protein [Polaribacter undariae]MDN3619342.1 WbqC family protein [Polaribacter undariae]UWD33458.1 WbqC family protein [Polaribacter undariae]
MSLFIPTYFGPISQYTEIVKSDAVVFEMEDNFQKQSYRNRCYIYNSNGKQLLNIPVKDKNKGTSQRKKTKDLLVDNDSIWQDHHLKSLQTAYRTSPFYEFYEDDLLKIFHKKYTFLQDVNIDTHLFITDALQISQKYSKTVEYLVDTAEPDFRELVNVKNQPKKTTDSYIQMFDDKHGFIPNLSILDLIFMEGPNAISYL